MRDFANNTRPRGTWQSWAAHAGLLLAVLGVACLSSASPVAAAATPAALAGRTAPAEIKALELREATPGSQLDVETDGAPIWTTYRNSDGHLVIELPNCLPAENVSSISGAEGLLQSVHVEVDSSSEVPMTRLVVTTRGEAEHSVVADGATLRVALMPIAAVASFDLAAEPVAEPLPELSAAAAEVIAEQPAEATPLEAVPEPSAMADLMEPIPGPSGSPIGDSVASQLRNVAISGSEGQTEIYIEGNGGFHFSTLSLRAPDRFVVDLVGVVNVAPETSISVENALVERVRVAQFKPYPEPVSRVVVDLRDATGAEVEALTDGLVVRFASPAEAVAEIEEVAAPAVIAEEVSEEAAEEVVAAVEIWEEPVVEAHADTGMGADERGGVGSHELSSLASAVATDSLDHSVESELAVEESFVEPAPAWEPEPVAEIAEARPEPLPEPMPIAYQDDGTPTTLPAPATFESQAVNPDDTVYQGEPMTMSLKDADIKDVLRSFAQISGLNVVVQPGVDGTVTVELVNVPWDQALEQILKINGLGYELEGNIMRVAPTAQLRAEAEERQRLAEAQALSIPLSTMMKRISYAGAGEVAGILKAGGGASIMSQRGSVVVDRRTNTLIIKELPTYMDTVLAVIENLDVPEPQVMIEARIIETTKRFASSLGIQWGFLGESSAELGNTTGLVFPNNGTVEGGVSLLTGGSNGFLDISLGNVLDSFRLDMTLQAAENEGLINILSAPKITTLNNEEASIQSGLQIPIQTVANNTVSVQFVNATLRLDVTPHVTAEGTVLMDINIQKREPQLAFAVVGATNAPIATKDARTRVIVRDGGTTVIGGIYKVSTDRGEDRVPGLANVPVIGALFKNKRQNDENEELLIFITPRVIKL